MTAPTISRITAIDQDRAIATLVTAFVSDPLIRWMFPEARQYLEFFPQVLTHFAGGAFAHDSAWCSGEFTGAALWLPPDISPDEEALGEVMQEGVTASLLDEVFNLLTQVGESHPREAHWYLPAIGVEPGSQGRGHGSALLKQGLAVCDDHHVAAYLETTNPANIPVYEHFGFSVTGEIQAGTSPVVRTMFRASR